MSNAIINAFGNLGEGIGQGLANYQTGRVNRRAQMLKDSQAAFLAGDVQGAYHLARQADSVEGVMGRLSDRQGPKLIGTTTERFVEHQGPPTAPGARVGAMAKSYDPNTPDFNNPANREAIRSYVGVPAPQPEYKSFNREDDVYAFTQGQSPKLIRPGAPKQYAPERPRYDVDRVTGDVKPVVPGVRFGVKPERPQRPHLEQNKKTGEWFEPKPGMVTDLPVTPEQKEIAKRVQAAQAMAPEIAKRFPWAGVQGVDPSTGDILINLPPAGAPLSDRAERMLRDVLPGTVVLSPDRTRLMMIATPDPRTVRAQMAPPPDPKLVTDATGHRVKDAEGVQVTAPKTWTPQMDAQALNDAEDAVAKRHHGYVPDGDAGEAEVLAEYQKIKAARMKLLQPAGPTLLQQLRQMNDEKKGGTK